MNAPGPAPSASAPPLSADAVVRLYHTRSKHRFDAYAAGPKMLDWDAQPAPFRRYDGAPVTMLPLLEDLAADHPLVRLQTVPFADDPLPRPPQPAGLASIGLLLQLALGITAWKTLGPDRWAVRANPSSGNLHPVEAWLIARAIPGLADGLHHYRADDHALECRSIEPATPAAPPRLFIALSSAMWREAWKYGERGFRYCQLDVGHAVGALAHAGALLGWPLSTVPAGHAALAHRLGLDRDADYPDGRFPDLEREEAEILLAVGLDGAVAEHAEVPAAPADAAGWRGRASRLDPAPRHYWPLIADVALATRRPDDAHDRATPVAIVPPWPQAAPTGEAAVPAIDIMLTRRSAQRFAASHWMSRPQFLSLLHVLAGQNAQALSRGTPPLRAVLFVHRVASLASGLYTFTAGTDDAAAPSFDRGGEVVAGLEDGSRLRLLQPFEAVELYRLARSLHCHQDIAANACLALGLIAPFGPLIGRDPPAYRDLLRSAGLIGQSLYLTAEALGLRGTGIGCFFDDPVHKLLGLEGDGYQTLYHFTIGLPIDDPRIELGPPYPASRLPHRPPLPEPTP